MADVAVVHPDLSIRGGAEDVCMHVLAALQPDHDLTLLTLSRPDVAALNRYFGTEVDLPAVRLAGRAGPTLNRRAGHRLARLQSAALARYVARHEREFDLVVSTKNEFTVEGPSVQYVHSPQFVPADPGLTPDAAQRAYGWLCRRLAGVDGSGDDSTAYLANSDWTARQFERAYGVAAETVYPPVDTGQFPDRDWAEREAGFLTVGRIGPSKRVLRNVEIVERVRERGHDVHLHIVGPTTDGEYADRVERAVADREFVSLEGAVDQSHLVRLLADHRYGLHGRPYEHFGIVVAEFVAAGMLPFIPDSGGQREIVDGAPELRYETADEAVEQIDRVLSSPDRERQLRETLRGTGERFGPARFREAVRATVSEVLS